MTTEQEAKIKMDETFFELNKLVALTNYAASRFRDAAESSVLISSKEFFLSSGELWTEISKELQNEIERLGGQPVKDAGSIPAALTSGWNQLRDAIAGRDETRVIAETERGVAEAEQTFRQTLAQDLPAPTKDIVHHQLRQIERLHNHLIDLQRAAGSVN